MKTIIISLIFLIAITGCTQCPDCICAQCESCQACGESEGTDCPICPASIEVTKYVCPDGRIMGTSDGCLGTTEAVFTPILTNEEGSYITQATISPACVYGEQGGTIFFKLETISDLVEFQVKEDPSEEYRSIHNMTNAYEGRRTFSIVAPGRLWSHGDFELIDGKVYLFRMKYSLPGFDTVQYSNEHIIDLREGSGYKTKMC